MKLFKAMLCSVAALSLLLPAAHAQAAPTVVKIALTQPTGHPTTDLIRGQFKKTIEEKTNGRFRIDVFDNYSFGNFEAVVQGLQFGMLQFAQESPSNLSIYDPKLLIFDLPYLMPDYDAVNILLDGKVVRRADHLVDVADGLWRQTFRLFLGLDAVYPPAVQQVFVEAL